jgi:hypothetical protein
MNVGVAILRQQEGLDCSEILADIDDLILNNKLSKEQNSTSHQRTNGPLLVLAPIFHRIHPTQHQPVI